MAQHVEQKMRVNVPASKIWEVLDDFSSIERFSPTVKKSPLLDGQPSGLGTKRLCEFHDGTSVVEEIIQYDKGEGFKVELTEYALPLKSLIAEMRVKKVDSNTSEISMGMDFVVKGGPIGWLMGFFMMRPMMKGVLKKVLTGLAYHSATGKTVGKELPMRESLLLIFGSSS